MKKLLFTAALFIACSQACFAALSPLNQSIVEYRAIINSTELSQYLNQNDMIVDIQRIENGYVIVGMQNVVMVDVMYQKSDRPGPKEFKLHFNPPQAIPQGQDQFGSQGNAQFTPGQSQYGQYGIGGQPQSSRPTDSQNRTGSSLQNNSSGSSSSNSSTSSK